MERLQNFIEGEWRGSSASETLNVINPASATVLAEVPLSPAADVNAAVEVAQRAFLEWRRTPVVDRVQPLFRLKTLLEQHRDELALSITNECGKTLTESKAEILRAVENVETACGMPMMMQGTNCEDIAAGIDEHMIRQPLGVAAAIVPFNFPGMIAFWFFPYAVAAGNCFLLKPSERVPITSQKLFALIQAAGFPPGVMQLVNGGRETVNAILDHPGIRAVSFVGSTATAKYIYSRAAANGKRAQCQGGAKNPVVVMPDADMEMTTRILADSAFGCAGQRCLAASVAITVGERAAEFYGADCGGGEESQDGLRRCAGGRDGAGDFGGEQDADRGTDCQGRAGRSARDCGWARKEGSGVRGRIFCAAHGARRRAAGFGDGADGDFRAGA